MSKKLLLVIAVLLLIVIAGYLLMRGLQSPNDQVDLMDQSLQDELIMEKEAIISLLEYNDSGENGSVVLEERGDQLAVIIATQGYTEDVVQPAHIHTGSCPDVGGVVYPLEDVVNGYSETLIDASLDDLRDQLPLGINIHKSAAEVDVYTACGDIEL